MKKIVITIFVLPHELDDLERVLTDLNRASKLVDGREYEFYVCTTVSDYLFNWDISTVNKEFFLKRFHSLKPLTSWAEKSIFHIKEDVMGAMSARRHAHAECTDATHFIWLDTDICFDDKVLYYIRSAIDALESTTSYLVTPEIVRYWDTTWDCLVNSNYMDKPLDYCKTNNPFVDSGVVGEVELERVQNRIYGQPTTKFASGWFSLLTKNLLDTIPIPSSMGHYGPEDTFLMWGIEKLNSAGNTITQYKLKNYVVCENYLFRNRSYYDTTLSVIDRKEEFKHIAMSNFAEELNNLR